MTGSARTHGSRIVRVSVLATVACALAVPAHAEARTFTERFRWAGDHAFTTDQGGSAVWWNQNSWDVRADTYGIAVTPNDESATWAGHYAAVLKARSGRPGSGDVNERAKGARGDGSPGIGVMHLDFQGMMSARLRNPMLISSRRAGVISFRAPLFVTTGHWWEVAITPANQPTPGEFTAVPARQSPEGLNNPLTGQDDDGSTNGPGHRASVEDAVNVISTGFPDGPTCDGSGWHARWALTSSRGGHVTDHVNPRSGGISGLSTVNPRKRTELVPWRIVYSPHRVVLYGDRNGDGKLERVDHWAVSIPWHSVYVNLLYVAYQAGHHPQPNCGYGQFGVVQAQSTAWRDVRVAPVAYARTVALPRARAARSGDWMSYDLRDIDAHRGAGQPNQASYDEYRSYLACSKDNGGGLPCPDRARPTLKLQTMIRAADLKRLARAQLLADLRYGGKVSVAVNGHDVGSFPRVLRRPDIMENNGFSDGFEVTAWLRRSVAVPASALGPGLNTVVLTLDPDTNVDIDRIQLELATR